MIERDELTEKLMGDVDAFLARSIMALQRDKSIEWAFRSLHSANRAMLNVIQAQQRQIQSLKVDVDDLVNAVSYNEQKHEEAHR